MIDCCRFDCAYARRQIEQELMEERKIMDKCVYGEKRIETPKTCPSDVTSTTVATGNSQDSILDMESFVVVDDSSF
jgi:hypothetical protein